METEAQAVAGLAANPTEASKVMDLLEPDDFQNEQQRRFFVAVRELASADDAPPRIDPHSILNRLYPGGQACAAADEDYFTMLWWSEHFDLSPETAIHSARTVLQRSMLRKLGHVAVEVRRLSQVAPWEAEASIQEAQDLLISTFERRTGVVVKSVKEVAREWKATIERRMYEPEKERGIPTGLDQLDALLAGGLRRGHMYVVGAESGGGKTAFLCHLARQAAFETPWQILHLSLEVPAADVWERHMSALADIPSDRMLLGHLSADDCGMVLHQMGRMVERVHDRMFFTDTPDITPQGIDREIRRRNRRTSSEPVGLVIVDYGQLLESVERFESQQVTMAATVDHLLKIAQRHNLVMLCAVQLNRGADKRADKSPVQGDIRETSRFAHAASAVILLHKPEGKEQHGNPIPAHQLDAYVRKNRLGATGVASMAYHRATHTFKNLGPVSAPTGW